MLVEHHAVDFVLQAVLELLAYEFNRHLALAEARQLRLAEERLFDFLRRFGNLSRVERNCELDLTLVQILDAGLHFFSGYA